MLSRREFLSKSALTAGFVALSGAAGKLLASEQFKRIEKLTPEAVAADEDFWSWVRTSYTVSSNFYYLNSAGVNPQPKVVQDAEIEHLRFCNEGPAYTMWEILGQGREPLRKKIAQIGGCDAEEIAFNRNSTEGLNTIIFGLNLKAGDEVVLSKYDYPNMMNAWKQRAKREGIKLVWIDEFTFPMEDDHTIVNTYERAITSKTKIVHVTHLINWVGQIVPARKIADMAHSKGCEVILDGAQTFAHIDFKIPDLGCEYFATSLHKWLGAPFGTGMMYVRKDKIKDVWALLSAGEPDGGDIRKFENLGTRSFPAEMAIAEAADFHLAIGAARKEARLRYLKDYWCNKVKDIPKVKLYTSLKPEYSCTIANFSIDGWNTNDIHGKLFNDWKLYTVGITWEKISGVRVSPNVFTSTDQLDLLVQAIKEIAASEPPKKKE